MKFIIIEDPVELSHHAKGIFSLFQDSFGFPLDEKLWEWAYIKNPNGNPVVALAYDEKEIVGHYAVIAFPLVNDKGEKRNSYLSMTTMVHPAYRKYGLFVKLAEATYSFLTDKDADLVCGFPNSMSAPGFKKRLGWSLSEPRYLVKTSKRNLLENVDEVEGLSESDEAFYLNLNDDKVKEWRFSKPGASYEIRDGLVTKSFKDEVDVVLLESVDFLSALPNDKDINILVPDSSVELKKYSYDSYLFGFRALSERSKKDTFIQQMFMSDVF